jgi:hypothetical protein
LRILVYTNILISREASSPIPGELLRLLRVVGDIDVKIIVHPKSWEEIERDKDVASRMTKLSKISTYPLLESPS